MPSGRVHTIINSLVLVAGVGAYGYAAQNLGLKLQASELLAFGLAFGAGTIWLSPDLDLAEQNVMPKKMWGPLGFLWTPYGWFMSHRGLSHSWLIGPLTRAVYLVALLALPLYLARQSVHLEKIVQSLHRQEWLMVLLGFYVSQWLHLIADGVAPDFEMKRSKRRWRWI